MLLEPTVSEEGKGGGGSGPAPPLASGPCARRVGCRQRSQPASIELYWLPWGAGGWFVRLNGRLYEVIHARLEHRRPLDLYHTALVVRVPKGR